MARMGLVVSGGTLALVRQQMLLAWGNASITAGRTSAGFRPLHSREPADLFFN
jgi:hypothetical protein